MSLARPIALIFVAKLNFTSLAKEFPVKFETGGNYGYQHKWNKFPKGKAKTCSKNRDDDGAKDHRQPVRKTNKQGDMPLKKKI